MFDIFSLKDFSFPKDFFFGSGYAGHQVEGNNVHSQRWQMEMDNDFKEKSGLACNSYELYEKDIELVTDFKHQAFRTSVEWSRVEPREGEFNAEAAEHYVKLFAKLKEKGVKVFATLVHISYPTWFDKLGGFSNAENLKYFERYAEYIVPKIAPYVDYWNVLNEHNLNPNIDFKLNSVIFHARGYHIIKKYSSAPVSTAHALIYSQPYRAHDKWDKHLAEHFDMCNNEFFFHAVRTGEIVFPYRNAIYDREVKDSVDFWSVNTYVRRLADCRNERGIGIKYDTCRMDMIDSNFYLKEFNPECVIANLSRLTDKPVIITENGCSCDDDRFRIVWITLYLKALEESMRSGIDVRGYLYWSLIDNYEWESFLPRFGLIDCNFKTFERTPKPSAYFYKEIIENGGFKQEILRKYLKEIPTIEKIK